MGFYQLAVGSQSGAAQFTRTVIVGSSNSVSAIATETQNGRIWTFGSWSNGGAQTHTVAAPAAGATYTATFTDSGPAEDKALDKASSASSVDEVGHEAGKGNDGSSTTRWSSSYTNNQWWQVDLGLGSVGGHGAVELGGGVRVAVSGADLVGWCVVLGGGE